MSDESRVSDDKAKDEQEQLRRPARSGKQGIGPAWTGEGDSSIERGQRAGETSKGGGSQWDEKGVKAPKGHREY